MGLLFSVILGLSFLGLHPTIWFKVGIWHWLSKPICAKLPVYDQGDLKYIYLRSDILHVVRAGNSGLSMFEYKSDHLFQGSQIEPQVYGSEWHRLVSWSGHPMLKFAVFDI